MTGKWHETNIHTHATHTDAYRQCIMYQYMYVNTVSFIKALPPALTRHLPLSLTTSPSHSLDISSHQSRSSSVLAVASSLHLIPAAQYRSRMTVGREQWPFLTLSLSLSLSLSFSLSLSPSLSLLSLSLPHCFRKVKLVWLLSLSPQHSLPILQLMEEDCLQNVAELVSCRVTTGREEKVERSSCTCMIFFKDSKRQPQSQITTTSSFTTTINPSSQPVILEPLSNTICIDYMRNSSQADLFTCFVRTWSSWT